MSSSLSDGRTRPNTELADANKERATKALSCILSCKVRYGNTEKGVEGKVNKRREKGKVVRVSNKFDVTTKLQLTSLDADYGCV